MASDSLNGWKLIVATDEETVTVYTKSLRGIISELESLRKAYDELKEISDAQVRDLKVADEQVEFWHKMFNKAARELHEDHSDY